MIEFDATACADVAGATGREWLETNGLGGFAMSTIIGMNTRRYHGLLIAATRPPTERMALLAKLEELLVLKAHGEERFELSCNQYPGVVFPHGYQHQKRFRLDPFPIFSYACGPAEVDKTVFMRHGENTVAVSYAVRGDPAALAGATLEVRPLLSFRDYHQLQRMNGDIKPDVTSEEGLLSIAPYARAPRLFVAHNAPAFDTRHDWYNAFNYLVDKERGYDYVEDLFHPFTLTFTLSDMPSREIGGGRREWECVIIASTERRGAADLPALREAEIARRQALADGSPTPAAFARALVRAADQFIVKRADGYSLIAGYPWFADWGRDAMISLPGLTLATGRADVAKSILTIYAQAMREGLIPNRFLDAADLQAGEEMEYNSIDGTLWMYEAARALLQRTGDDDFVRSHLYQPLRDALDWYVKGTRFHIRMDDDGLISGGEEGIQLTWMDAKVNNWVVTPRYGKPVEVQALWYNALCVMRDLAGRYGDEVTASRCAELAERASDSFARQFWNEAAGCLYDLISADGTPDAAIRPNQILAASLPHSMLSLEQASRVVDAVQRALLVPLGLRTLAPDDYNYRGRYEGNVISRDSAYHQGTAWPWLIGPFITAYLRVNGRTPESVAQARAWLAAFEDHLNDAGLGQISEIFDGNPPHTPRGCVAQAWSVAELLRVIADEGL